MKIAFFDSKPYDKSFFNEINNRYNLEFKFYLPHLTPDNVVLAKGYDAVCVFVNDIITESMINELYEYGVKLIALRCSGFNNIDFKSAYGKIHVVRVPAYSPYAIAEHSVALMLSLNRKIHRAYFRTRDANFALNGLMGFDMHGKTVGIIGTGKIGRILIQILRGFGMEILAYDPFPDKKLEKEIGCKFVDLDSLYKKSDIISLNCPLTKDTEYLINKENIEKMKEGVMLINTGRGKLINTRHLIAGLKSGKIGSAGLDVYEEESEFFFEDLSNKVLNDDILARLLTFNNVIITSHQGFFTKEAMFNIAETTMNNINQFFNTSELVANEICYHCQRNNSKDCLKTKGIRCF